MKHLAFAFLATVALTAPACAGTGTVSGTGFGPTEAQACAAAQSQAQSAAVLDGMRYGKSNAHVTSFGSCGCTFHPSTAEHNTSISGQTECTVSANYATD
ncbi:MAG: hypothetical protein GC166_06650 [Alphaproteobacteria bacterium]|nr:hypothetical protein [Alphaproteobacteria bacterium]